MRGKWPLSLLISFLLICMIVLSAYAGNRSLSSTEAQLGWVSTQEGICGGYYQEIFSYPSSSLTSLPIEKIPIEINADESFLYQKGTSIMLGNVKVSQPNRSLTGDKVYIYRQSSVNVTNIDIYGHVKLREYGKLLIAKEAHIALSRHSGYLIDVLYRILLKNTKTVNEPTNAWGKAKRVEQINKEVMKLQQVTYTTCSPTAQTWQIAAKDIVLDKQKGIGITRDAVMRYKGVPIFYMPYWRFPIDHRRKSGFLFPNINYSSRSGVIISMPYYWNISSNKDATITPVFYTQRGTQLAGQFRYMTHHSLGIFNASYLYNDKAFARFKTQELLTFSSNNRAFFTWKDQSTWNNHWSSHINYDWVSDDYYLADFNYPSVLTMNQLLQEADIHYVNNIINFSAQVTHYQTLHPVNQTAVGNPYNSLPRLDFNVAPSDSAGKFNYQFNNQLVYFHRDLNPGETLVPPAATRLNIQPSANWLFTKEAAYFNPKLQLSMTGYEISHQLAGFSSHIQRVIPILNIDSGLHFSRELMLASYRQTVEPRFFYLYVPFINQNSIPLFDTGLNQFTYDNLFSTNRFTSIDRIGDANQLTYSLTTRFFSERSGDEKFSASVGQIVYFKNRQVNLCSPVDLIVNSSAGTTCANPQAVPGLTSATETFSPIAGLLNYHFNPQWSTTANIAWDPTQHVTINSGVNIQYHPLPNHLFNLSYDYIRFGDILNSPSATSSSVAMSSTNNFNRIGFSFAWPLLNNWSTVGGLTYSINRAYAQTYFYGLEYQTCCWAFRVTAGRSFYALNKNNNPEFNSLVYLQWQFKGLSTISSGGNNTLSTFLKSNIPGYQDNFSTPPKFS